MTFYVGLDLGQANDYTAICIAEDVSESRSAGDLKLNVRHLERFRDVLYPDVADRVETLLTREPLRSAKPRSELVIDATGVGPAVTDIFTKRGRRFKAVKIHGGDTETHDPSGGVYRVPKRNLISALVVLLQNGSLRISSGLELAGTLREELLNFRVKVNIATAHDSYEAWREGDHDDLVLAAALSAWGATIGGSVRPAASSIRGIGGGPIPTELPRAGGVGPYSW